MAGAKGTRARKRTTTSDHGIQTNRSNCARPRLSDESEKSSTIKSIQDVNFDKDSLI